MCRNTVQDEAGEDCMGLSWEHLMGGMACNGKRKGENSGNHHISPCSPDQFIWYPASSELGTRL